MRTNVTALPATAHIAELAASIGRHGGQADQRLYPVLSEGERLEGVISRSRLLAAFNDESLPPMTTVHDLIDGAPVVAQPGEPLRAVVYRMADTGLTRMPVVDPHDATKLAGMVALGDLLKARTRTLDAERRRERVLRTRMLVPGRRRIEV
jgi:CBS domain-containing protein